MQRYNRLSDYLKKNFGKKLLKLSIDGGFSCPNRKNGNKGCKFCSQKGSGEFTNKLSSITEQMNLQKNFLKQKDTGAYIAYFQNYTNTYMPASKLKQMYYEAIKFENVKVLSIATRADCFNDEIYNLLEELSKKIEVWIELGLQSSNEKTRDSMNIGYDLKTFKLCVKKLKKLNIKLIFHIIFGLPNETIIDFKNTIDYVNELKPWGLKIHNLYIQSDCELYKDYLEKNFKLLDFNSYIDALVMAIENLDKDIVIHRITGDGDRNKLIYPTWSKNKIKVIGQVGKILKEKNSFQGKNFKNKIK